MYSLIIFLVTLLQLIVVMGSYSLQAQTVFYTTAVYGSPIYIIMHLFTSDSAWIATNPVYLMLLAYHVIKYALFFRARAGEGGSMTLRAAIVFEIAYLCISGYYVI